MLARLALSPEALDDFAPALPVLAAKTFHAALLEAMNAHGTLVFASDAEAVAFVRAVKAGQGLPPGAAQKWEATLTRLHRLGRVTVLAPPTDTSLSSVRVLSDLRTGWGGRIEVAVVGADASSDIGVPASEGLLEDSEGGLEVATMVSAPQSRTISRYRELAAMAYMPKGAPREKFWGEVLAPIASKSRTVTVLDGYLLRQLWFREERRAAPRNQDREQVVWLLDHLDQTMQAGSEVHLIGGFDRRGPAPDAQETADLIRAEWGPPAEGRLSSVRLTLAPQDRRFPHDRHIRFSTGVAVLINAGFDRLRERAVWDENGMGWQYRWSPAGVEELRAAEQRVRTAASADEHAVVER